MSEIYIGIELQYFNTSMSSPFISWDSNPFTQWTLISYTSNLIKIDLKFVGKYNHNQYILLSLIRRKERNKG